MRKTMRSFTRMCKSFDKLANSLDGKFNTQGVRYAIRLAYDKKAEVYYCTSVTQLSDILQESTNTITKKLATKGWFAYRIDGQVYVIMKEYKGNTRRIKDVVLEQPQKNTENKTTTEEKTEVKIEVSAEQEELEKEIYEKLQEYFKMKKYSDDACKNHAKKVIDDLRSK